jgi:anti-sigma factor RsiW
MDRKSDLQLLRLLRDELPAAQAEALRRALADDVDLRRRFERLQAQWDDLVLPPPEPAPPGFADKLVRRVEASRQPLAAAGWADRVLPRAVIAAALAAGIGLGVLLAAPQTAGDWDAYQSTETTLAEAYWVAVDESAESGLMERSP